MAEDKRRHFLVFAAQAQTIQDPNPVEVGGRRYEYQHRATGELAWLPAPVGAFFAPTPEQACAAAAQKIGTVGTFFALEGTLWGIAMNPSGADEVRLGDSGRAELEQ